MEINRGQLWWADLGEPRGSAPARRRPVLVVSADAYNRSRLNTVTVVVVTTNRRLAAMPGNVALPGAVTGLPEDSVANVTQVVTVDRAWLTDQLGAAPDWLLEQIDRGLRRALAL
ncbi:MAG: type II toxin-antitoxin system PemK/MazF family toxin [Sporichthyaceae bacterium]